jgi:catechol 2,3-dioxygenase-like lactoylglutathione lyase family enzyme
MSFALDRIDDLMATLVTAGALTGGVMMMMMTDASAATKTGVSSKADGLATAAVRYQIRDVDRAIKFYTDVLDFKLEQRTGAVFAMVSRGALQLVLSGPGTSGARPMPDGRQQEPGGWNRIILYVPDLNVEIEKLKTAHAHFRNTVEVGPGGKQILVEDPDGNPIELHEGGAGASK